MENVIIRKGEKKDCPKIYELIKELANFVKSPDGVKISLEQMTNYGFGHNPIWNSFIAENEGKIVGIAIFYDRFSTWRGRILYLEDLIVTEKLRGSGIGKLLLDDIISYSKNNNYNGVVWQVMDWMEPAINFYKKYDVSFDTECVNVSLYF